MLLARLPYTALRRATLARWFAHFSTVRRQVSPATPTKSAAPASTCTAGKRRWSFSASCSRGLLAFRLAAWRRRIHLTVPIFVYVLGFAAKPAIAMSLPVVGAASLVGAIGHWRAGM